MRVHIGASGWVYPHWRGRFYPSGLPEPRWLDYYASHFASVEVNNSFYRLPPRETFAAWRAQTPAGFVFAVKANRYITHMKKLKEPAQTLPPLWEAVAGLGEKLGPLLFQLPPNWRPDFGRLKAFLEALPRDILAVFELRDARWHTAAVLDLLSDFNAAFCVFDLGGRQSPRTVTADFAYVRLHGPEAAYCGRYGRGTLLDWADWLNRQRTDAAYVYFDNDQAAYAVQDAMELKALLGS
jgi:uncharacterized protein YecE (DUF72 family)